MRYLLALTVAAGICGAGIAFVWYTNAVLINRFEEVKAELRAQRDSGTLPPEWQDVNLEQLELSNVKMRVSDGEMFRLAISLWLAKFWYVFVPLVFVTCLGVAAWTGRKTSGLPVTPTAPKGSEGGERP